MARSFTNTKLAVSALIDGVSVTINRSRGFSSVASQAVGGGVGVGIVKQAAAGEDKAMMKKKGSSSVREVSPWVPDPVTGYYRPENRTGEIDVAELREVLLNHKITTTQH
ncbi:Late embryogenesis abundant protein [Macleaya cordata]|uniref:Late embryogenesis abundant protein n=1 Tax=Macleaya cordata TaxID=56857 RepID=A0A200QQL0_MACCD|nr:Late embryogenesis abundant protein [Macleaya cordata]